MTVTSHEQLLSWSLYQARTDSQIDWEKLKQLRDRVPLLNDRERCELLLRAVNGDALPVDDWHRLVGAPLSPGAVAFSMPKGALVPLYEDARAPLRAALERVVADPYTAKEAITGNASQILKGSVIELPAHVRSGRKWVKRRRVVAESLGPALIHALDLFLDDPEKLGSLLRRCMLPECGKFAMGQPPTTRGQPRNFYCTREHQRKHARLAGKERSAAHRAGKTVEEWRKIQARSARQE
jgi:hypothetical protein